MNKSKRIAISLVAGVLAALLCMVYGSSIRSQAEQVQAETLAKYGGDRVEVCVAARDIDVGETLDETNVITQEWLTSLLPRDAATELRQVRGDVTTSRIPKNAVICNVYTKAESHKLEVPKGKVAVSVAVDAEHSVGGATAYGDCRALAQTAAVVCGHYHQPKPSRYDRLGNGPGRCPRAGQRYWRDAPRGARGRLYCH